LLLIIGVVLVLAFSLYVDSAVIIPFAPTYAVTQTAAARATPIPSRRPPSIVPTRSPRRTIPPTPIPGEQANAPGSEQSS
jgi:hypothetical protein